MRDTKRQDLPMPPGLVSGLWVVATPIGNLDDLSPRARGALQGADVILCEDTRRTLSLLTSLGMTGPRLERLDAHSEVRTLNSVVERLSEGVRFALVTDAGTPGVSDPAAALVRACQVAGIRVTPVVGPSAVTALLSVAGFSGRSFVFRGFFPRKKGDQLAELTQLQRAGVAEIAIWFESPERILDALNTLSEVSPQLRIVVGKELTKLFEKLFAGTLEEIADQVGVEIASNGARGEWCFALELPQDFTLQESSDWVKALELLINAGVSASDAARQVSQSFGVARKKVYSSALECVAKKSTEGGLTPR